MFLGEHQHSLDAKGRVILPARFRDQLEDGAVMAKALDGCLAVYPVEESRAMLLVKMHQHLDIDLGPEPVAAPAQIRS